MKLQRLLSLTRQAVDRYQMIQDQDHIAVGISGGKDSLTLLYALGYLKRFYPHPFKLSAITVDLGIAPMDLEPIRRLCEELEIPYQVVSTEIGRILFQIRQEQNPCALCAKLRKGALNEKALELGCNRIAYAHHRDDLIETALMSLFYEGRFYAFSPKTHLDRTGLSVIRPLLFASRPFCGYYPKLLFTSPAFSTNESMEAEVERISFMSPVVLPRDHNSLNTSICFFTLPF